MNITNMKITDIRPYEKNPRHNEDAVEAVLELCIWHSPSGAQLSGNGRSRVLTYCPGRTPWHRGKQCSENVSDSHCTM